jgi:2'-hydroxyisoflavone reductase
LLIGKHPTRCKLHANLAGLPGYRMQSNPGLYPQAEPLHGDRSVDLGKLDNRRWDAVIDTCGYVPRVVRLSLEFLAQRVEHYTFISTLSVYADASQPGQDESAPLGRLPDETVEVITGETYGPLKALCEQVVAEAMPERALLIRPGLIVGPYDPSDRFTYWPHRVAQGGEVLAPGSP